MLCSPVDGFEGPLFGEDELGRGLIGVGQGGDHAQHLETVAPLVAEQVIEEVLAGRGRIAQRNGARHHLVARKVRRLSLRTHTTSASRSHRIPRSLLEKYPVDPFVTQPTLTRPISTLLNLIEPY